MSSRYVPRLSFRTKNNQFDSHLEVNTILYNSDWTFSYYATMESLSTKSRKLDIWKVHHWEIQDQSHPSTLKVPLSLIYWLALSYLFSKLLQASASPQNFTPKIPFLKWWFVYQRRSWWTEQLIARSNRVLRCIWNIKPIIIYTQINYNINISIMRI